MPEDPDPPPFLSSPVYLSVTCTEDLSRINPGDIDAWTKNTYLGDYRLVQQMGACALWPAGPSLEVLARPVKSTIPALLITGDRDPVTPPSDAYDMAQTLANARVVIVPHAGHMPFDASDPQCLDSVMLAFLKTATPETLDLSCIDALQPPAFELNQYPRLQPQVR